MATSTMNRESWDSLTSTFTNLEVSFSQDSCYGSDEVSVTSNNAAPLQSSVTAYQIKRSQPDLQPFLKSILKNPRTEEESESDSESESGYGSDENDSEYDALSDEENDEEDSNDDMSDFSVWEETSQNVPETQQDHTDSFDDSFIGFEPAVQFNTTVQYFDAPEYYSDDEEEGSDSQMTVHEMMLLSLQSGGSQGSSLQTDADDMFDDGYEHNEVVQPSVCELEEYTREGFDLDCNLFVALMNGIHGISDQKYKSYLRVQVDNIRLGQQAEPMHPDDPPYMYLDSIVTHVIGIFRNLLEVDEFDSLISLREHDIADSHAQQSGSDQPSGYYQALLDHTEQYLFERLAIGRVEVDPDELSFLAGGIVHALGTDQLPASTPA
ncbi:hypothetical protein N7532_011816 [Penicillium argentinense]|uniref:Uncharacterized protein n=1 Tax=Penicillium argentinense TaxID=1131581 RepID=A0A9W9EJ32_9EURO|nr:uncharacterized protein N7532_011816 [Penicillium argentinense]KAJ5082773.1 hypothetical protein N7532_011816 [Penicillium argentinense]